MSDSSALTGYLYWFYPVPYCEIDGTARRLGCLASWSDESPLALAILPFIKWFMHVFYLSAYLKRRTRQGRPCKGG